jgi:mono/diheme cytochrome c family protein
MRKFLPGIAVAVLLVPVVAGMPPAKVTARRAASATAVARGKYLVESIAMCGDCHSPRNEKGEFIQAQWLQGAPLEFKPTVPRPVWVDAAPAIAGLPGWEKDVAVKFLMTGVGKNGLPVRPPMPQYRFNVQDALAIVAYLKSLAPAK